MSRGITQEDVWKACDALLLEGARPTIERVRQKIGRGSPNTVSPFLETWFKQLGGRIADPGAFAAPSEVPDIVQQAAHHFWQAALAETRLDFDERLRDGLAAAVASAEAEKERATMAEAAAFEATANATRLQADVEKLQAQVVSETQARVTVESQLASARDQVDELRVRLDQAVKETSAVRESSQRALAEAIHRFTAAERRAALEIDAARVAKDNSERRADALEQRLQSAAEAARTALEQQSKEQTQLRAELAGLAADKQHLESREVHLGQRVAALESELAEATRLAQTASTHKDLAERLLRAMKTSPVGSRKAPPKRYRTGPA